MDHDSPENMIKIILAWTTKNPIWGNHWVPLGCRALLSSVMLEHHYLYCKKYFLRQKNQSIKNASFYFSSIIMTSDMYRVSFVSMKNFEQNSNCWHSRAVASRELGGRLVNPISTRGLLILHTQYYEPPPLSRIFRPCDGPAKLKHLEQKILSCNKYYILTRTMYENDHKNVLVFDIWLSLVSKIKHSTILIFLCQKVGGQIFLIFFVEEYKN